MSVLKYKDPVTGEFVKSPSVKVIETVEGGETITVMGENLKASGYEDYIAPEVADMIDRVNGVRKSDSIVFIAMADSHYVADQASIGNTVETNASTLHANQAAKVLSYLIRPDFFAHLGDVSCGHATTDSDMLKKQIEGFISYFREARSDLPVFICIGNHDTGIYFHNAQTDGKIHTMTGEYLYKNFTSHSLSLDTVFGGEENGGYCYRDFADKKLRVFMLNTSEKLVGAQSDSATYGAQRAWLANALLDLNSKDDAAAWGFIILSHYPADYGNTMPLSELFKAYVEGNSITVTDPVNNGGDGTAATFDFSGKNAAKFMAQFHGHVHNFLTSKLYSYATGSGVQYDANRVCIPNGQYDRENYYTTLNAYPDISFAEPINYPKTPASAEGTSFVVNVINPSEKKIYSFCYGAGYDRVIGIGGIDYFAVTSRLSNVNTSNGVKSIEKGMPYQATLTPSAGYFFKKVTVTMSGLDITATAYKDGVVNIAKVIGNVVITAKARAKENFTNLVPLAINEDGSDFFVDGDGYADDTRLNSSGVATKSKGRTTTGFIPVPAGAKVVRIAGEGITIDTEYTRFALYDADFNLLANIPYKHIGIASSKDGRYYSGQLLYEDSTVITWVMEKYANGNEGVYMRVCVNGEGDELAVTVNEEISYGAY